MALTARQEAALAKAPPAARAGMRKGFLAQRGPPPAAASLPLPKFGMPKLPLTAAKPQPKPRPAKKPRAKKAARGTGERTGFPYRHLPLPELEAPYAVLTLPLVIEFSTQSTADHALFLGSLMHQALNASEAYYTSRTDYIAIQKDVGSAWTGNNIASWRSSILDNITVQSTDTQMEQRLRLNGMTVNVRCVGASAGLYPSGEIFLGKVAMYDYVSRGDVPILSRTLIQPAIQSGRLMAFTATDLMKPVQFACAPDDIGAFKQWTDTVIPGTGTNVGDLEMSRGLEIGVVYIPRLTGNTTFYRATVTCEWCLRDPSIVTINALARSYPPTPLAAWNIAMGAARDRKPHHVS